MIPKILTVTNVESNAEIIERFAMQNEIPSSHRIIVQPEKDELTVEQIHQMQQDIQVTFERTVLVVLIGVDDSSGEVQNSLLKCLEEESHRILFLFLVNNPTRLLPTILSRCTVLTQRLGQIESKNEKDTILTYFSLATNSEATKESAIAQIDIFLQSTIHTNLSLVKYVLTIRNLIIDNNMNPVAGLDSILLFNAKNSTIKVPIMKNKKSFTLIELLVVIAVLAGMMALLVPNFMAVREKSRDMKRKSDLKSIQKALELYNQNQTPPIYPTGFPTPCQPFTDANGTVYMQKFPLDPLVQCSGATSTYYYAQPTPGQYYTYIIGACMENSNDPEVVTCPVGFQTVTNATCSTNKCYLLTEP